MSTDVATANEDLSASKIDPLASDVKANVPHDTSGRGAVGTDHTIDQSRIEPIGGKGQYQHPLPADDEGVVGKDGIIQGAKIAPLDGGASVNASKAPGIDDAGVSGSRIAPLGEVREELS